MKPLFYFSKLLFVRLFSCSNYEKFQNFSHLILVILILFTTAISCKKTLVEEDFSVQKKVQNVDFEWSDKEKRFFNGATLAQRNNQMPIYHPMLFAAIRELAEENSTSHFVERLQNDVGNPLWNESVLYFNPEDQSNLIIVPFAKDDLRLTSGVLTIVHYKNENSKYYIKNGLSRTSLYDVENGDPIQKLNLVKATLAFDLKIFNFADAVLANTVCTYLAKINDPDNTSDCIWRDIEICWLEDDLQSWWYPGNGDPNVEKYKDLFDGDHDNDGIPDMEDQDYQDWYDRFNDFWDELGIDGDINDFWDGDHDNDGIPNQGDSDWDRFWDDFRDNWDDFWDHVEDGWEDFIDWWSDVWGDFGEWLDDRWEDFGEWWDGWFRDIDCPDFDPGKGVSTRGQIICQTFRVLDCENPGNGSEWYDDFRFVISCPGCPVSQDQEDLIKAMIPGLRKLLNINILYDDQLFLLIRSCDLSSMDFIRCVNLKLEKYKNFSLEISNSNCPNATPELIEEVDNFVIENGASDVSIAAAKFHFKFSCHNSGNYTSNVPHLGDWVESNSIDKYIKTAVLFNAATENSMWIIPDPETLYFYWIVFAKELAPIGITLLPFGIGDAADIYQSCNDLSWGCFFAMAGILLPDEIFDLWRKSDDIKDAWKATEGFSHLVGTWKKIYSKFPALAKNLDAVKYVDNLAEPKFGSYFATSNTYATNFKNKFNEVRDQIAEVHHAVPQEISDKWNLVIKGICILLKI